MGAEARRLLLLLGGGHAHVQVLAELAARPLPPGWQLQLVSPSPRQLYSGMLPGWIAGHYRLEQCEIDLAALAARAGARFTPTAAVALDADARRLHGADGSALPFELLSIDTGAVAALEALPGASAHALPVRPIRGLVEAWPALAARIAARRGGRFELLLVGAGAAGVELAFALRRRGLREGWSQLRVSVLGSEALPLPGLAPAAQRRALALLRGHGIVWHGGRRAAAVAADHLRLQDGTALPADATLLATGAAAPSWPRLGGLATDAGGFIRVDRGLQSVSHPWICAAGDVAAYPDARPKSGVFAVRAGPVLAASLRALCAGRPPEPWTPQRRSLVLLSTADRRALACWGPLALDGAWAWWWKDRIDRAFIARYAG